MTSEDLRKEFENRTKEYEVIQGLVEGYLSVYKRTSGTGIIRSYTSRIKEWKSFFEKVEREGYSATKVWDEVNDILGVRIVCLFRSDLDLVDEWLHDMFRCFDKKCYEWGPVPQEKFRQEVRKVAEEGYTSIHYIVGLKENDLAKGLKPHKFEIQTRTMLQDAWAEFNHEIYKRREEVPEDIRRSKVILSKYLSAMDDHFQLVREDYLRLRPVEEAVKSKDLEGKDFSGQEFFHVDFSGQNLRGTKFVGSRMLWCNLDDADLSGADLTEADLSYAKMRNAKLTKAVLYKSRLNYADLSRSNLNYANMEKASLSYADLSYAKLRSAKLRYADLAFAVLRQTSFREADLRNTILVYNYYYEEADFENADTIDATIVKREKFKLATP